MNRHQKRARKRKKATPVTAIAPSTLDPLEKEVGKRCDSIIEQCGGDVVNFSEARPTRLTRGIPDRRYRFPAKGIAFWWELKREVNGKLTDRRPEQVKFGEAEIACGERYGYGGVSELMDFLTELGVLLPRGA